MSSRPKLSRGFLTSFRGGKSLKKKGKKGTLEGEDNLCLAPHDVEVLLGRIRVILAHIEGNAEANDILFLSSGAISPDAKEAAQVLVEALANDDTIFLVQSLQRFSCATLSSVVKMTFMSAPQPLIPGKVCSLILNSCAKYAEYLDEKNDEKVEEIGATLERFSRTGSLEILEGLCQCLKRLPMPKDELAYIFAPLVLLPKFGMLTDENISEEDLNSNFELLAAADLVIEAMEFMIEKADVLFDSRSRKRALLKKGLSQQLKQDLDPVKVETVDDLGKLLSDETEEDSGGRECLLPQHDSPLRELTIREEQGSFDEEDQLDQPIAIPEAPKAQQITETESCACSEEEDNSEMAGDDIAQDDSFRSSDSAKGEMDDASISSAAIEAKLCHYKNKPAICTANVLFDYEPNEDGEMALVRGEVVDVLEMEDDGWWFGRNASGMVGVFPGIYVQRVKTVVPAGTAAASPPPKSIAGVVAAAMDAMQSEAEAKRSAEEFQVQDETDPGKLHELVNLLHEQLEILVPQETTGFEDPNLCARTRSLFTQLMEKMAHLEEENQQLRICLGLPAS